jgi:hypothetical protein
MDLLFLRLDAIIALSVNPAGEPVQWQAAHLLPRAVEGQPYHLGAPQAWTRTAADFAATAQALEDELSRVAAAGREAADAPRALLVSVSPQPRLLQERNLDELAALADTAGLTVAGRMVQRVAQVNPRLILGKGKVAELEVLALQGRADMLVFDGELAPTQLHNLADITERKVMDRTQLILDIFAQHAVTRAGKLQVELAQLRYTQPRLVGKNRAMDRLMGGIGGRGPGETKLETDRRKIRERMARIRAALDRCANSAPSPAPAFAPGAARGRLVGYTNAGKSTLLNTLTRSDVLAENNSSPPWTPPPADCASPPRGSWCWPTPWLYPQSAQKIWEAFQPPWRSWKPPICFCMWPTPPTQTCCSRSPAWRRPWTRWSWAACRAFCCSTSGTSSPPRPGRNWPTPCPTPCPFRPAAARASPPCWRPWSCACCIRPTPWCCRRPTRRRPEQTPEAGFPRPFPAQKTHSGRLDVRCALIRNNPRFRPAPRVD